MITKNETNSHKLVRKEIFENIELAIESINSGSIYGELRELENGTIVNSVNETDKSISNKFYFSELENRYYEITIQEYLNHSIVYVYVTYLNRMIVAAESGNVEAFEQFFENSQKMIDFAADRAIQNGHWNIINCILAMNKEINDPVYRALKYDKASILNNLLNRNFELNGDWLQQAIREESISIIEEFLFQRKIPFKPSDTIYFRKVINDKNQLNTKVRIFLQENGIEF
jgi:hypothetical protein